MRALRRRLDHGDVARLLDVAQAEFDRVGADRGGDLVDERLAGEMDLRPDRIALYAYAHLPERFTAQRRIATETLPDAAAKVEMLSRSIAATGHASRRGQPIGFQSLYAYLIAPAWWLHSTAASYAAIKYLNALVMCLTAVPTYFLARLPLTLLETS